MIAGTRHNKTFSRSSVAMPTVRAQTEIHERLRRKSRAFFMRCGRQHGPSSAPLTRRPNGMQARFARTRRTKHAERREAKQLMLTNKVFLGRDLEGHGRPFAKFRAGQCSRGR